MLKSVNPRLLFDLLPETSLVSSNESNYTILKRVT